MFSAMRRRMHFSPATVIASLALVFAMTSGAYAAGHYLITSTKQISPKVLKSLKGANGAAGANGANGAAGPQGSAGVKGENGAAGGTGPAGPTGPQGTPGTPGAQGPEGSFNKALPSGKTLKGVWSLTTYVASVEGFNGLVEGGVSFGIPLASAPVAHYFRKGEEPTAGSGCTGNVEEPGAEKGNLCVFAAAEENSLQEADGHKIPALCNLGATTSCLVKPEVSPFGFGVLTLAEKVGPLGLSGTWAVTAE